ncbi:MAG: right-handed parallel beta-helix repeat-containing protein [Planctomycetes bacterium]|nr:right-handed parallel beta-helix repeat-containing protein [Planctomycetota bacterium]
MSESRNPSRPSLLLLAALVPLVFGSALRAQVTYVNAAAAGANNGANWSDAYVDLQTALQATTAGEIWVAAGTYYPGSAGNRAATFQLRNGVELYGGFAGTETQRIQRSVAANPVTLSGDIDQNDTYGTGAAWWRTGWSGNAGNSYHIVTGSGTDATAVLDGFRMFAARADDPANHAGGGLYVNAGSPTLRNCTIQYCAVGYGSSAYLNDCGSTFENCVIRDGYTCNCGSGGWVSGALVYGTSNVTFTDCAFINHYYVSAGSQGRGAALRIDFGSTCTVAGGRFEGNQTGNFYAIGGGTAQGAGINSSGALVVDRCEFIDNFAHAGAGIAASGPVTITNSLFARNTAVPHAETSQITYGDYGAALLLWGFSAQPWIVTNCTFVDNDCEKGAGIANYGAGTATVANCIVYHNWGPATRPVFILKRQITGAVDLSNCCVEGLFQTEPGEDPPDPANYPGCFDTAPAFVSVAGHDYHVLPHSSCINSGDPAALPGASVDLEGNPRVVNRLDLGCYEFAGQAVPSFYTTNLVENWQADFSVLNANPGEAVFFLYSFAGVGPGPCLPAPSTVCAGLRSPVGVMLWKFADAFGRADYRWQLPQGVPVVTLHFQAAMIRGVGAVDSVTTNTMSRTISLEP